MPQPEAPNLDFSYSDVEALFLDVGGTLVTIDFDWLRDELATAGVRCHVSELLRAEAAARPVVSARLAERDPSHSVDSFVFFLTTILEKLLPSERHAEVPSLCERLVPILRVPRPSQHLWSYVLPGVREALVELVKLRIPIVAVSNADGTVEWSLTQLGLRDFFAAVVDSHVIGFAKPDPRIFEHALELTGVERTRTLHVGDMYFADVVGARRAGIPVVLLDPFEDWHGVDCERLPDMQALAEQLTAARSGASR